MKKAITMLRKKEILVFLFALLSLSACNTKVPSNIPVSTPTPIISTTPTPEQPTVSVIPTSTPTPIESIAPAATPTPIASPSITSDVSERATLSGKVYSDRGVILNDILVTVESSDKNYPFKQEIKTSGGVYVFRDVPVAVPITVRIFKSDTWTSKEQSVVLKSNLSGDPDQNILDFGDGYAVGDVLKNNFMFISDSPEIVSIEPKQNGTLEYNGIKLKFKFNENIRKNTFEDNFQMRYVSQNVGKTIILGDGTSGTTNTDGPPLLNGERQIIIDKSVSGAQFVWDTGSSLDYGKEVSFSIPSYTAVLTSNKNTIFYGISLRRSSKNAKLMDIDGNVALDAGEFFLSNARSKNVLFNVLPDITSPELKEVKLSKDNNNCYVRLIFSKPMVVIGFNNPDLYEQSFYTFYKNDYVINPVEPLIRLINPDTIEFVLDADTFEKYDKIKVKVSQDLKDPAGNFFSQGQTNNKEDYIKEDTYKED